MAVQWRTETSTGNLTECYRLHVRSAVEERRLALGFRRHQVFFNIDLVGQASTTYNASVSSVTLRWVERSNKDVSIRLLLPFPYLVEVNVNCFFVDFFMIWRRPAYSCFWKVLLG